ncbi:pentatricopeptide repeat-containing protein [Senna tora]|uniref:Pentatricopeptide repeat-containing protein n=1 Tax=Senna tora TaxID=362788 RepID=A0A834WA14_9FABA|nr:pentatricopeptide repeat-containing protein [Senna tora]
MAHVSDIKLIRTDTTLDLSQKAEKATEEAEEYWGRPHYGSLLLVSSSVALALHYCLGLAHPTKPSLSFSLMAQPFNIT